MPNGWRRARRTRGGFRASPRSALDDDSQPLHTSFKGGSREAQDPGRAALTADPPTGLLENRGNVLALDVLEAPRMRLRAPSDGRCHDGAELEATTRRQDDGSLDEVLQL